uniref:Calmodulin-lysine N-methyltransferase n=1 Tax=Palpitomonas bilix TaxID=652834 RepID=A0A7S3CZI7_9EUKA|mmetsp:Transcript_15924/g.40317  ORF Transcript_15924/g.40317 Transcript_15924/m.40317 type:complete len:327 (+) Transcript_15924:106-1086(+)
MEKHEDDDESRSCLRYSDISACLSSASDSEDEDGYLITRLKRKAVHDRKRKRSLCSSEECEYLHYTIKHKTESTLDDVGLQMWSGSLILADYFLSDCNRNVRGGVFEIGAGCGFLSLILSEVFEEVYCTDSSLPSLELAAHNAEVNDHVGYGRKRSNPRFLPFDWSEDTTAIFGNGANSASKGHLSIDREHHNKSQWRQEDFEYLRKCNVLVGADVVYNEEDVPYLIGLIEAFMKRPIAPEHHHLAVFAVDERKNFDASKMRVSSGAYEVFYLELKELCKRMGAFETDGKNRAMKMRLMDLSSIDKHIVFTRPSSLRVLEIFWLDV